MKSARLILLCCAALWIAPGAGLAASGGGGDSDAGSSSSSTRKAADPSAIAEKAYKRGLRKRDTAWKHQERAANADSEKVRSYELKKADRAWADATTQYRKAVRLKTDYHQAHSSLGYALRKQGKYDESIAAYGRALEIEPEYAEAIEYQAEAYLSLNRLEEVIDAHRWLNSFDREKSALLMTAIEAWIASAQQQPPPGVTPDTLTWFGDWAAKHRSDSEQDGPASDESDW
jgi:tetratricopeptide (TPR) repeat protein